MNVTLISCTADAMDLLIFSKGTRLGMTPKGMEEVREMPEEEKSAQLRHIKNTIKSSWEFVDFTFLIDGVTRAFTHQLVRTRTASYAQQSQRAVDISDAPILPGPSVKEYDQLEAWEDSAADARSAYTRLLEFGVNPQDARGIMPTNTATNILMKASLRTLHDMAKLRLCVRTQGEYQEVFKLIRQEVYAAMPWTEGMLEVHCVSIGTCAFHDLPLDQCSIKPYVFNPETGRAYDGGFAYQRSRLKQIHDKVVGIDLQPPVYK